MRLAAAPATDEIGAGVVLRLEPRRDETLAAGVDAGDSRVREAVARCFLGFLEVVAEPLGGEEADPVLVGRGALAAVVAAGEPRDAYRGAVGGDAFGVGVGLGEREQGVRLALDEQGGRFDSAQIRARLLEECDRLGAGAAGAGHGEVRLTDVEGEAAALGSGCRPAAGWLAGLVSADSAVRGLLAAAWLALAVAVLAPLAAAARYILAAAVGCVLAGAGSAGQPAEAAGIRPDRA